MKVGKLATYENVINAPYGEPLNNLVLIKTCRRGVVTVHWLLRPKHWFPPNPNDEFPEHWFRLLE